MPNIKLQSTDGDVFEVDLETAKCFGVIRDMLENLGENGGGDDDDEIIPLAHVDSAMMRKVIIWATHHKNDLPESSDDEEDNRSDNILPWDKDFLNVGSDELFQLLEVANYLDINSLLIAACKTVANMIRNKTVEQIRAAFDIQNDFTPAEEERIRTEYDWREDSP